MAGADRDNRHNEAIKRRLLRVLRDAANKWVIATISWRKKGVGKLRDIKAFEAEIYIFLSIVLK